MQKVNWVEIFKDLEFHDQKEQKEYQMDFIETSKKMSTGMLVSSLKFSIGGFNCRRVSRSVFL